MAVRAAAVAAVMVAVAAVMMAVEGGGKGGAAAAPPVDCASVVLSMADCLSYVTNGSTVEKPEGNCCSGLKSVLKTNPECLCEAFKSSSQFGVVLNVSKALALPSSCHVHAPSPTNCGLSVSPAGAPVGAAVSPAASPTSYIANAPSMGVAASITAPASAPAVKSGSLTIGISLELIFVGVAAMLFSSF